jgi:dTDP-4-amino-4,6-dideoxygalactose transaminase
MVQPYLFSNKIAVISNNNFIQPSYRISPFKTEDIKNNRHLHDSKIINDYYEKIFYGKRYVYTTSGRAELNQALSLLNLDKKDIVTIFTTTGNFYISSCVTDEIEKYCKWGRTIGKNTKAILVNHEFGFPYEKLSKLTEYNLPIIEDCAHSFFSQNHEKNVGKTGDYIIYSLPKFFPIQLGGLLVSDTGKKTRKSVSDEEENYIRNLLSHYIINIEKIKLKRIENYRYLEQQLGQFGFTPRFELCDDIHCPGVYLFNSPQNIDLSNLKIFMQSHGVECSIFYKEDTFFLPVHQKLEIDDLDYFVTLIKYFLEQ